MFVMNENSLMNKNPVNMDFDDDYVPVIYHFDSSPDRQTPDGNDPVKFVYSF